MNKNKENSMNSENQSMLVSERRPNQGNSFKVFQSNTCNCSNAIRNIEAKLEMFELRLEQMTATSNICFTKQMEHYGRLVDEQKKRQNMEYLIWDMKEISQAVQQKLTNQVLKQQQCYSNLNEEVQNWTRVLRDMKSWKNGYSTWSSNLEKNIFDSFKQYKQQNDEKLMKMYSAVEQIGLLQRKMLQKSESSQHTQNYNQTSQFQSQGEKGPQRSRAMSYHQERQSMPVKKSINESTMMYSRYK